MVAVFTGNALGFLDSSLADLGGTLSGTGGRNLHGVNAANGNLILSAIDETLFARGMSVAVQRYYNSQGLQTGTGGTGADAWRTGFEKHLDVTNATGAPGGFLVLTDSDGTSIRFDWDSSAGKYVSAAGEGAHDTFYLNASNYWIREDADTARQEWFIYAGTPQTWRLHQIRDFSSDAADPTRFTFLYDGSNRLTEVRHYRTGNTGTDNEALLFTYDGDGRLATVATREGGTTRHQVSYGYDSAGRLVTIDQDLVIDGIVEVWNPAGGNDGKVFRTTYTYDGTSMRIASVTGSDGYTTSYTYDASGRIATVRQGGGETQTFSYFANRTDVVDTQGHVWSYHFGANNRLSKVEGPTREGLRDVTEYDYVDEPGTEDSHTGKLSYDLRSITTKRGGVVIDSKYFEYDHDGFVSLERDGEGRTVTRTRTWTGSLLVETITRYTVADPDGTGPGAPSGAVIERHVYDDRRRLRFVVDEVGLVTETVYDTLAGSNANGLPTAVRRYNHAAYTGTCSLSALTTWSTGLSGDAKSKQSLTTYFYDLAGRLQEKREFATVDTSGNGVLDLAGLRTTYAYDAQGLLRTQIVQRDGAHTQATDYIYDGIGRLLHTVRWNNSTSVYVPQSIGTIAGLNYDQALQWAKDDLETEVASTVYRDSLRQIVLTTDAGATVTEVRDTAGRLVQVIEGAAGQADRNSYHYYDADGQRIATRTNNLLTYFFYDERGNHVGTVDAAGSLTEMEYDALGRLTRTFAHDGVRVTTSWASGTANATTFTLPTFASVRRLWNENFTDTAMPYFNTTDLLDPTRPSLSHDPTNGRLVLQRTDNPDGNIYPRLTGPTIPVSQGPMYRLEVTTGASLSGIYGFFGLHNTANFQAGISFSGGKVNAYSANVGSVELMTLATSTTYVVELIATETGVEARVFVRGQDPSNAVRFQFTSDTYAWQQCYLNIQSQMGAGLTGQPLYVDNVYHSKVRVTTREYDLGGLLEVERSGLAATTHAYDGAGRLVQSTTTAPGLENRVVRRLYDANDTLLGVIDAEGFLTENAYDVAGRLLATIRYAKPALAGTTIGGVRPSLDARDQTTRYWYDQRDRLIGSIDAEEYLTTIAYDEQTYSKTVRRFALDGVQFATGFADVVSQVATSGKQETQEEYDHLGRLKKTTDAYGTVTQYHYDHASRLVRTEVAVGQAEVRHHERLYDVWGNLVAEIDPANAVDANGVRLVNDVTMTFAQKYAVFLANSTRHVYDALGRRTETIDVEGNATWYFYDAANRPTFTARGRISASGVRNAELEITETRYNAFGQIAETIGYLGTPVNATKDAAGAAAIIGTIASYADAAVDNRRQYLYDTRGLLIQESDAEGGLSVMRYDAIGQLLERKVYSTPTSASTTTWTYDKRGLEKTRTDGAGSTVARTSTVVYDAFGRAIETTDGRGVVRKAGYDRLGRIVSTSIDTYTGVAGQIRTEATSTTWDAYSRVYDVFDARGYRTQHRYDDAARTYTVTTPENVVVKTTYDRHRQVVSVEDVDGSTKIYEYDRSGHLTKTIDEVGDYVVNEYDKRGLLWRTTDGNGAGNRVMYKYDAAGRVLVRTEDTLAGGLLLESKWTWDALGRETLFTDANGDVVRTESDRNGRTARITRDYGSGAGFLNLVTTYEWDDAGRQVAVTEGAGTPEARRTEFTYDALGRRESEKVDAGTGKLNLTTTYEYDAADNVVVRTDAAGNVTRFAYDEAGRLSYTLTQLSAPGTTNPSFAVTRHYYDDAGNLSATRRYLTAVTLSAAEQTTTETGTATAVQVLLAGKVTANAADEVQYLVRDKDGRLRFQFTQTAANTAYLAETRYDSRGYAVHTLEYVAPISLVPAWQGYLLMQDGVSSAVYDSRLSQVATWASAAGTARQTVHVINGAGRERFTLTRIDGATMYAVEKMYDDVGRVKETIVHHTAIAWDAAATVQTLNAAFAAEAESARTRMKHVFDRLGRLRFTVDDAGAVVEQRYDGVGRVQEVRQYLATIAATTFTESAIAGLVASVSVAATKNDYDGVGRLTKVTDALNAFETFTYDAVGNRRTHVDRLAKTTTYTYDGAGRLKTTKDALNFTEFFDYDNAGNRTKHTDKLGNATIFTYDSRGNLTSIKDALQKTETFEYDALGNKIKHTDRLANVTTFGYDTRGNLTSVTDALLKTETFVYDGLGNRTSYTDKRGSTWTYAYDRMGRLVREETPTVPVFWFDDPLATTMDTGSLGLVTKYTYDALGNVLTRTENAGDTVPVLDQRKTTYEYDNRGNLVRTIFPAAWQIDPVTGTLQNSVGAPTIETTYDALGREIAQKDTRGIYTYRTYDLLGRVAHAIDGEGYVTSYAYDAEGRITRLTRRAAKLADNVPANRGTSAVIADSAWTTAINALSPLGNRVVITTYDAVGRKTKVQTKTQDVAGTDTGIAYWNNDGVAKTGGVPTTEFAYDAEGRLILETLTLDETRKAETRHWYDVLGRRTHTLDAEKYLTKSTFDANGNELTRTEYARAIAANPPYASAPEQTVVGDAATGYDRSVTWTYDALGRKATEAIFRRYQDAEGLAASRVVTTTWGYDAEDNNTTLSVDGIDTVNQYDALGRLISVTEEARSALKSDWQTQLLAAGRHIDSPELYQTVTPYTRMHYDAFGKVICVYRPGGGVANGVEVSTADDQTSFTRYDYQGRAVVTVDAAGQRTYTTYDAADNVQTTFYEQANGIGGSVWISDLYSYDRNGNRVEAFNCRRATAGGADVADGAQTFRYNAFGEVVVKAWVKEDLGDQAKVIDFVYDGAGNLITSEESGAPREYKYNLAGQQIAEKRDPNATYVTRNVLDRLGRVVTTVLPPHSDALTTSSIVRVLDRWGNVLQLTDARGAITNWTYDDRNQALTQLAPLVDVMSETGVNSTGQRPETHWWYDAHGRLIGVKDANGNVDKNVYDATGRLKYSLDAHGYATRHAYDALGRDVLQQDALGYLTTRTFDRLDRVTAVGDFLTTGGTRTRQNRETYILNRNGDRISVTNGEGEVQLFNFDGRGLLLKSRTQMGVEMQYEYDYSGMRTTETHGAGTTLEASQTWTYDIQGRLTAHEDLGGNDFSYGYDSAGRLASETSSQMTVYAEDTDNNGVFNYTVTGALGRTTTYYANGLVKEIRYSPTEYTLYEYDANGNRTLEKNYKAAQAKTLTTPWSAGVNIETRITYDSHNRITRITTDDFNQTDFAHRVMTVTFGYDAVGNRRFAKAVSGYGEVAVQEAWYSYDGENRVVSEFMNPVDPDAVQFLPTTTGYDAVGRVAWRRSQDFYGGTGILGGETWKTETFVYNQRGERIDTSSISIYTDALWGEQTVVGEYHQTSKYDMAGRLSYTVDYYINGTTAKLKVGSTTYDVQLGGVVSGATSYEYDEDGRVTSQIKWGRKDGESNGSVTWVVPLGTAPAAKHYSWDTANATLLTKLEETRYVDSAGVSGYDDLGRMSDYRYSRLAREWRGYNPSGDETYTHQFETTFVARDSFLEGKTSGSSSNSDYQPSSTVSWYDAAGRRHIIEDHTYIKGMPDPRQRRQFAFNGDGQILLRTNEHRAGQDLWEQGQNEGSNMLMNKWYGLMTQQEWENLGQIGRERWYDKFDYHRAVFANGQQIASSSEGGGDLAFSAYMTGFTNTEMGRTKIVVQEGDNLQTLAQRAYGTSSMWYVIAEANGLSDPAEELAGGTTLDLPQVKTVQNDYATFKPYDPSEITGPTTPDLPYIPKPDSGCNAVAMVIMIAIAIVATIITAGAAAVAMGATGGIWGAGVGVMAGTATVASGAALGTAAAMAATAAGSFAGSVASMAIGSSMGIASFSWKSALSSGVAAGLTAGIGATGIFSTLSRGSQFAQGAMSSISSNLISQATDRAFGVQTSFSWKAIAADAVTAGISNSVSSRIAGARGWDLGTEAGMGKYKFTADVTSGVVGMHVRRKFGIDEEINYGSAVGSAVVRAAMNSISGVTAADAAAYAAMTAANEPVEPQEIEAENYFGLNALLGRAAESEAFAARTPQTVLLPPLAPVEYSFDYTLPGMVDGTSTSGANAPSRADRIARLNTLFDEPLSSSISDRQLRELERDYLPQRANGGTPADVLYTTDAVEVTAPRPKAINPFVAWSYSMQGLGVLRRDVLERQVAARSQDMGVDPQVILSLPNPRQAVQRTPADWTEQEWSEFRKQDTLNFLKFATSPIIAAGLGAAGTVAPVVGLGLSIWSIGSGANTLRNADSSLDYAIGTAEIIGGALGLGQAASQLRSVNSFGQSMWMPLGHAGSAGSLSASARSWQSLGVPGRPIDFSKLKFEYVGPPAADSRRFLRVTSDGVRGEVPLTAAQRTEVDAYLSNFDLDGVVVRHVDDTNLNTGYLHGEMFSVLNIGSDVVPGNVGLGTLTANSRISIRGTIAHELVGHREAALMGRTQSISALEEAQASIRAARFAPGLSSAERFTLLRDGITRLHNDGRRIRDYRDVLYIQQR